MLILLLGILNAGSAQDADLKGKEVIAIGFWNVENLYDTINDKWKNDEDFTPEGVNVWNGERYRRKILHLSECIGRMAVDANPDGLALMGLCEVENESVVKDLVASPLLIARQYKVIHIEGPDARGVDPSFIYQPKYFTPGNIATHHVKTVTDSSHFTRDILVISGSLKGESIAVLVNHWPSRRGGELLSRPNRNEAARIARKISDSIVKKDPACKVLIMGDLNDDPMNQSVKKSIGTYGDIRDAVDTAFFNPMEILHKKGIGSLAHRDNWNLFDQILLNRNLVHQKIDSWQYFTVRVFNQPFLKSDFGNYKGYPLRTYSGGTYAGGYSDHFPVYVLLARAKK